jgi:hypothetical protein
VLLDVDDFLHACLVPASGERSGDPGPQNIFRLGLREEPGT